MPRRLVPGTRDPRELSMEKKEPALGSLPLEVTLVFGVDLLMGRQLLQAFAVWPLGVGVLGRADPSCSVPPRRK